MKKTAICLGLSSLFMISGLIVSANSQRVTITAGAWGSWGAPSVGVLKTDSNNGYFENVSTSALLPLYGDAYYAGERVSDGYVNISVGGRIWFAYKGIGGSAYNGKYIQARASTSNTDPNSAIVNFTFAP